MAPLDMGCPDISTAPRLKNTDYIAQNALAVIRSKAQCKTTEEFCFLDKEVYGKVPIYLLKAKLRGEKEKNRLRLSKAIQDQAGRPNTDQVHLPHSLPGVQYWKIKQYQQPEFVMLS